MEIPYVISIHIIFVVSWMAGLFYIVRLFVYHIEANDKPEPDRGILQKQFIIMEQRLWNAITTPAMLITVVSGLYMLIQLQLYTQPWMMVKLGFVGGLLVYHFICQNIIHQFKKGIFKWTSNQLRIWNEVATIFLVAIVFTVILKSTMDWLYGVIGLILFGVVIMSAVKIYKNYRLKS